MDGAGDLVEHVRCGHERLDRQARACAAVVRERRPSTTVPSRPRLARDRDAGARADRRSEHSVGAQAVHGALAGSGHDGTVFVRKPSRTLNHASSCARAWGRRAAQGGRSTPPEAIGFKPRGVWWAANASCASATVQVFTHGARRAPNRAVSGGAVWRCRGQHHGTRMAPRSRTGGQLLGRSDCDVRAAGLMRQRFDRRPTPT